MIEKPSDKPAKKGPSRASPRGIQRRRSAAADRRADVPIRGRAAGRVLDVPGEGTAAGRDGVAVRRGTPLAIRLVAPSTTINMAGVVAWSREQAQGPGQPAGMGITLAPRRERIGAAVDKLAFEFRGVKALVAASQAAPRALLIRYLRSIITCSVVEIDQAKIAESEGLGNVDLTVIDLDSAGAGGLRAVRASAPAPGGGLGAGARGRADGARSRAGRVARLRRGAGESARLRRPGSGGAALPGEADRREADVARTHE